MRETKEKMHLYHFYLPPLMNANLELLKRLTGLNKSELIRAAIEIYSETRLKEYDGVIDEINKVFSRS